MREADALPEAEVVTTTATVTAADLGPSPAAMRAADHQAGIALHPAGLSGIEVEVLTGMERESWAKEANRVVEDAGAGAGVGGGPDDVPVEGEAAGDDDQ